MRSLKFHRVGLAAILGSMIVVGMSFVPGSIGTQMAGAVIYPTSLTFSAFPSPDPVGTHVLFTAVLSGGGSGGLKPTGDISAGFYTSPHCSNTASFTLDVSPNGVHGNGSYSAWATPPAPGTYHGEAYFASTSGANPSASSGDCNFVLQVLTPDQYLAYLEGLFEGLLK